MRGLDQFLLRGLANFWLLVGGLPSPNFRIIGTEPFWAMQVTRAGITFEALGGKKQTLPHVLPQGATGKPADAVRVYKLGAGNTLIIQRVDRCSDGMSDRVYPFSALFIRGRSVYSGCAFLEP